MNANEQAAYDMGYTNAGIDTRLRAPAMSKEISALLEGNPVGHTDNIPVMRAYLRGFDTRIDEIAWDKLGL